MYVFFATAYPLFAQLQMQEVCGGCDIPSKSLVVTHDDLPDQNGPDGTSQTMKVAQYMYVIGSHDSYFTVFCHFLGTPLANRRSSLCPGFGDRSLDLLKQISQMGIGIYNHSFSHVAFSTLSDDELTADMKLSQSMAAPFQKEFGLHAVRCPGFNCGPREMSLLNKQSDLPRLRGPVYTDVGGWFCMDDGKGGCIPVGGDWWFYANGYSTEETCKYYVRDIVNYSKSHGVVILLHLRTEVMTGADGSKDFPIKLLQCIVNTIPWGEYHYAPLDAIPGYLGNIQTQKPVQWTEEFGPSDGFGPVRFGDLDGNGKSDAFKARDGGIWSLKSDGTKFLPSTTAPQLTINNPEWSDTFGHTFWLVDLNGDRKVDIVYPSNAGLMFALSDGANYSTPALLSSYFATWSPDSLQSLAFGDFYRHGQNDIVAWTPDGLVAFKNNGNLSGSGHAFDPPTFLTNFYFAKQGWGMAQYRTVLTKDLGTRGLLVCMRGSGQTFCSISDGKTFTFPQPWTNVVNDKQGWGDPKQYQTLTLATIAGKVGLAGGVWSGIIFDSADLQTQRFSLYRYINNEDYSILPDWHPERGAFGLGFADLDQSGNESPVITRTDGLYVGLVKVIGE